MKRDCGRGLKRAMGGGGGSCRSDVGSCDLHPQARRFPPFLQLEVGCALPGCGA